MKNPRSRFERWNMILKSGNPEVFQILDEVLSKYDPNNTEKS